MTRWRVVRILGSHFMNETPRQFLLTIHYALNTPKTLNEFMGFRGGRAT